MNPSSKSSILLLLTFGALAACAGGDASGRKAGHAAAEVPSYREPLTGEALEHFERAKSAADSSNYELAASEYAKAIELAPYNLEAHEAYASAVQAPYFSDKEKREAAARTLEERYRTLLKESPNPVALYMLGDLRFYPDGEESRELFQRAVELDPTLAPAWFYLSLLAERVGDQTRARSYLRRAAEADPTRPDYNAYLAMAYRKTEWDDFTKHGEAFVKEFPGTWRAAQVLYWLGASAPTPEEKIRYHRWNIEAHPIEEGESRRNGWTTSSYSGLYEVLRQQDPDAAVALARTAMKAFASTEEWSEILRRQSLLNLGRTLREAGRIDAALPYLNEAGEGRFGRRSSGLKREVDIELALVYEAQGDDDRARGLLLDILERNADITAQREFERMATAAGWSEAQIMETIWTRRLARARPAPELGIPDLNGKLVHFADYPGKVILVNFWYPACGPCRGEFPYLAESTRRLADRGFVVLAINGLPEQEAEVQPFMENTGYPFIPLLAPEGWAEEKYRVRGYPANFIVDPQGRIVYEPGIISSVESQAEFERWLNGFFDYLELTGTKTGAQTVAHRN